MSLFKISMPKESLSVSILVHTGLHQADYSLKIWSKDCILRLMAQLSTNTLQKLFLSQMIGKKSTLTKIYSRCHGTQSHLKMSTRNKVSKVGSVYASCQHLSLLSPKMAESLHMMELMMFKMLMEHLKNGEKNYKKFKIKLIEESLINHVNH